uniref:Uncharacterized protein n=1 Tax=Chromera velia CCMP2878 TaxID=1169474 RepID=A0A0G4FWD9_9ALVE|eukprot:Cvel_19107.t1-p1 / transcript=Cvel_19107.t1 / gene=Cvel_19107 / organism=Chromera_velia_CCMP2878 / gene_product=hypothetical protein / transcript_product=hypothetical protein / location=Cvel_scaffold1622:30151-37630(-) / protein_length=2151 / sequence_SO=supercontig / SO=protein_coding / is_pseudo=false
MEKTPCASNAQKVEKIREKLRREGLRKEMKTRGTQDHPCCPHRDRNQHKSSTKPLSHFALLRSVVLRAREAVTAASDPFALALVEGENELPGSKRGLGAVTLRRLVEERQFSGALYAEMLWKQRVLSGAIRTIGSRWLVCRDRWMAAREEARTDPLGIASLSGLDCLALVKSVVLSSGPNYGVGRGGSRKRRWQDRALLVAEALEDFERTAQTHIPIPSRVMITRAAAVIEALFSLPLLSHLSDRLSSSRSNSSQGEIVERLSTDEAGSRISILLGDLLWITPVFPLSEEKEDDDKASGLDFVKTPVVSRVAAGDLYGVAGLQSRPEALGERPVAGVKQPNLFALTLVAVSDLDRTAGVRPMALVARLLFPSEDSAISVKNSVTRSALFVRNAATTRARSVCCGAIPPPCCMRQMFRGRPWQQATHSTLRPLGVGLTPLLSREEMKSARARVRAEWGGLAGLSLEEEGGGGLRTFRAITPVDSLTYAGDLFWQLNRAVEAASSDGRKPVMGPLPCVLRVRAASLGEAQGGGGRDEKRVQGMLVNRMELLRACRDDAARRGDAQDRGDSRGDAENRSPRVIVGVLMVDADGMSITPVDLSKKNLDVGSGTGRVLRLLFEEMWFEDDGEWRPLCQTGGGTASFLDVGGGGGGQGYQAAMLNICGALATSQGSSGRSPNRCVVLKGSLFLPACYREAADALSGLMRAWPLRKQTGHTSSPAGLPSEEQLRGTMSLSEVTSDYDFYDPPAHKSRDSSKGDGANGRLVLRSVAQARAQRGILAPAPAGGGSRWGSSRSAGMRGGSKGSSGLLALVSCAASNDDRSAEWGAVVGGFEPPRPLTPLSSGESVRSGLDTEAPTGAARKDNGEGNREEMIAPAPLPGSCPDSESLEVSVPIPPPSCLSSAQPLQTQTAQTVLSSATTPPGSQRSAITHKMPPPPPLPPAPPTSLPPALNSSPLPKEREATPVEEATFVSPPPRETIKTVVVEVPVRPRKGENPEARGGRSPVPFPMRWHYTRPGEAGQNQPPTRGSTAGIIPECRDPQNPRPFVFAENAFTFSTRKDEEEEKEEKGSLTSPRPAEKAVEAPRPDVPLIAVEAVHCGPPAPRSKNAPGGGEDPLSRQRSKEMKRSDSQFTQQSAVTFSPSASPKKTNTKPKLPTLLRDPSSTLLKPLPLSETAQNPPHIPRRERQSPPPNNSLLEVRKTKSKESRERSRDERRHPMHGSIPKMDRKEENPPNAHVNRASRSPPSRSSAAGPIQQPFALTPPLSPARAVDGRSSFLKSPKRPSSDIRERPSDGYQKRDTHKTSSQSRISLSSEKPLFAEQPPRSSYPAMSLPISPPSNPKIRQPRAKSPNPGPTASLPPAAALNATLSFQRLSGNVLLAHAEALREQQRRQAGDPSVLPSEAMGGLERKTSTSSSDLEGGSHENEDGFLTGGRGIVWRAWLDGWNLELSPVCDLDPLGRSADEGPLLASRAFSALPLVLRSLYAPSLRHWLRERGAAGLGEAEVSDDGGEKSDHRQKRQNALPLLRVPLSEISWFAAAAPPARYLQQVQRRRSRRGVWLPHCTGESVLAVVAAQPCVGGGRRFFLLHLDAVAFSAPPGRALLSAHAALSAKSGSKLLQRPAELVEKWEERLRVWRRLTRGVPSFAVSSGLGLLSLYGGERGGLKGDAAGMPGSGEEQRWLSAGSQQLLSLVVRESALAADEAVLCALAARPVSFFCRAFLGAVVAPLPFCGGSQSSRLSIPVRLAVLGTKWAVAMAMLVAVWPWWDGLASRLLGSGVSVDLEPRGALAELSERGQGGGESVYTGVAVPLSPAVFLAAVGAGALSAVIVRLLSGSAGRLGSRCSGGGESVSPFLTMGAGKGEKKSTRTAQRDGLSAHQWRQLSLSSALEMPPGQKANPELLSEEQHRSRNSKCGSAAGLTALGFLAVLSLTFVALAIAGIPIRGSYRPAGKDPDQSGMSIETAAGVSVACALIAFWDLLAGPLLWAVAAITAAAGLRGGLPLAIGRAALFVCPETANAIAAWGAQASDRFPASLRDLLRTSQGSNEDSERDRDRGGRSRKSPSAVTESVKAGLPLRLLPLLATGLQRPVPVSALGSHHNRGRGNGAGGEGVQDEGEPGEDFDEEAETRGGGEGEGEGMSERSLPRPMRQPGEI